MAPLGVDEKLHRFVQLDQPEVVTVANVGNCEAEIGNHAGRQMVMIILDRMMANKYGQLKKRLACQVGVLSQVGPRPSQDLT